MCRVCLVYSFAPAIHLLRLKVASIFEQLHVVEQEANHSFCFFQIRLHLCRVLRRFPRAHHPHVLQRADTEFTALHVLQRALIKHRALKVCASPSAAGSPPGWAAPRTRLTPSGLYWRPSEVAPTCRGKGGGQRSTSTSERVDYLISSRLN